MTQAGDGPAGDSARFRGPDARRDGSRSAAAQREQDFNVRGTWRLGEKDLGLPSAPTAKAASTRRNVRLMRESPDACQRARVASDFHLALSIEGQEASQIDQSALMDAFVAMAGVHAERHQGRA